MFGRGKKNQLSDEEYDALVKNITKQIYDEDELKAIMESNNLKWRDVINIVKNTLS